MPSCSAKAVSTSPQPFLDVDHRIVEERLGGGGHRVEFRRREGELREARRVGAGRAAVSDTQPVTGAPVETARLYWPPEICCTLAMARIGESTASRCSTVRSRLSGTR